MYSGREDPFRTSTVMKMRTVVEFEFFSSGNKDSSKAEGYYYPVIGFNYFSK